MTAWLIRTSSSCCIIDKNGRYFSCPQGNCLKTAYNNGMFYVYVSTYSSIPNKRGGRIKRVGGNFVEKCVVHQINELMGFFFSYLITKLVFQSFKHTLHIFEKKLIEACWLEFCLQKNKRGSTFIRNARVCARCRYDMRCWLRSEHKMLRGCAPDQVHNMLA